MITGKFKEQKGARVREARKFLAICVPRVYINVGTSTSRKLMGLYGLQHEWFYLPKHKVQQLDKRTAISSTTCVMLAS
jgi:hypothetical protein